MKDRKEIRAEINKKWINNQKTNEIQIDKTLAK